MSYRPILISATFLFLFAVIGSGLVAFTFDSTAERIADNQRKALLKSLNELVPSSRYDNDIFADTLYADSSEDVLDPCAPESLRVVGTVTLRAIEQIASRLSRVDEFTRRPLAVPVAEADVLNVAPKAARDEGTE